MNKYTKPCFKGAAFNCPHCGVYSRMEWDGFYNGYNNRIKQVEGYFFLNLLVIIVKGVLFGI